VPKSLLQFLQGDNLGDCKAQGVKSTRSVEVSQGAVSRPILGRYHKPRHLSARGMTALRRMTMGMATESNRCAPSEGEEQHAAYCDRRVIEVVAGDGVRLRFCTKWSETGADNACTRMPADQSYNQTSTWDKVAAAST